MKTTTRLSSLLFLGALTMAAAPLASAEEPTDASIDTRIAELEQYDTEGRCSELEGRRKLGCLMRAARHHHRKQVKEACDAYEHGSDEFRECAKEQHEARIAKIKENHPDFEPGQFKRRQGKRMGRRIGHGLREKCGELTDEARRDCIRDARSDFKQDHPRGARFMRRNGVSEEMRNSFRECKELDDRTERRDCMRQIRDAHRNSSDA